MTQSIKLGMLCLVAVAVLSLRAGALHAHEARGRLNVLFILTDDLGYGDLACYAHPRIKSPRLDRLAKDGMRFTQFYVTSPVCTPTRASFMTGRHPQRFGIHYADLPERLPRYPLPLSAVTIAELLARAGYHTAHFGKWHLGEPPQTGMPRRHGFERFFGSLGGRPSSSWSRFARYDDAQFIDNESQPRSFPGHATDVTTDHVLAFLDSVGGDERPFYINVWFNAPHAPLSPNVREAALYKNGDGFNEKQKVYFGTVTNMDHNVGRILDKLDALGIAEQTLVVFSSDNGPEVHSYRYGAGSAGPLRGMKTQLWEGGIRVPLIVRLPEVVPAGSVSRDVASALDFLPTVSELTGVEMPDDLELDEGMSLVPSLKGHERGEERSLYWEYHGGQRGGPPSGTLVIRDGDWKLHVYVDSDRRLLYNLADDLGEQHDLAASKPDIVARLESKAIIWYRDLPKETSAHRRVPVPETEAEANRLPL